MKNDIEKDKDAKFYLGMMIYKALIACVGGYCSFRYLPIQYRWTERLWYGIAVLDVLAFCCMLKEYMAFGTCFKNLSKIIKNYAWIFGMLVLCGYFVFANIWVLLLFILLMLVFYMVILALEQSKTDV